ncbi:hypothetical protein [Clostridium sp. VAP51]|uniref:hypothetical protein n=1 Tax=Clostridium sp. VAP51 TaxID=2949978 RepID=UPI00207A3828|nr:hypothetical protein [Clostridium sp. VAP51]
MVGEMNKIMKIIEGINKDSVFEQFQYKDEFIAKWKDYLNSINTKVTYFLKDETDKDQVYVYELPILGEKMEFDFSIKYIRDLYFKYPQCKKIIKFENVNGKLFNGDNECYFTPIEKKDIKSDYNDLSEAIIIPFPQGRYTFIAIDGNHRINHQIYNGIKSIEVIYADYVLAAKALATPLQICTYCLIEDYFKIRYNLGKYEHKKILNTTNIVKKEKTLNIIQERNK